MQSMGRSISRGGNVQEKIFIKCRTSGMQEDTL